MSVGVYILSYIVHSYGRRSLKASATPGQFNNYRDRLSKPPQYCLVVYRSCPDLSPGPDNSASPSAHPTAGPCNQGGCCGGPRNERRRGTHTYCGIHTYSIYAARTVDGTTRLRETGLDWTGLDWTIGKGHCRLLTVHHLHTAASDAQETVILAVSPMQFNRRTHHRQRSRMAVIEVSACVRGSV